MMDDTERRHFENDMEAKQPMDTSYRGKDIVIKLRGRREGRRHPLVAVAEMKVQDRAGREKAAAKRKKHAKLMKKRAKR